MYKYETLKKVYYKNQDEYKKQLKNAKESKRTMFLPINIFDNQAFIVPTFENDTLLTEIYKLDSELKDIVNDLPPIAIITHLNESLIKEVILTNDIEGVYSTRKDITDVLKKDKNASKELRFEGMVNKYALLLSETSIEIPLEDSLDIRSLYDELMAKEINDKNKPDGKIFRKDEVNIVTSTQTIKHTGVYPEHKIVENIDKALEILKNTNIPMLYRISIFHFLFGYIHPFYDGNGRMSRFISSYLLRDELNVLVSLRLSYIIKNDKNYYYDAFDECNNKKNSGDLTYFITCFLTIIKKTLEDLIPSLKEKKDQYNHYINLIENLDIKSKKNNKTSILHILILKALFTKATEGLSRLDISQIANIGKQTTTNLLNEMIKDFPIIENKKHRPYLYSIDLNAFDELSNKNDK